MKNVIELENFKEMNTYKTAQDYLIKPFMKEINNLNFYQSTNLMKIIVGKTGQGKTFTMAKVYIKELAKKGVEVIVVSCPNTEILDGSDFVEIASLGYVPANNTEHALQLLKQGYPKVLVLTCHKDFAVGKNSDKLADYLMKEGKEFAIFIDEAHTWLTSHIDNYRDNMGSSTLYYEAKLFKLLQVLSKISPYIFGLTATPHKEQLGKLKTIGTMKFKIINDSAPKSLLIDKTAYFRSVTYYDPDFVNNKFQIYDLLEEAIIKTFNTKIKKALVIAMGSVNTSTGHDVELGIHLARHFVSVNNLATPSEDIISVMTGEKNKTGVYNINENEFKQYTQDEIKFKLEDPNDPLRILIVVEKGKMGMSVRTLKTIFSFKTTDKKDEGKLPLVEFAIQFFGRLVRLNTLMSKKEFFKKWGYSLEEYIKTLSEEELLDLFEANSIDLYLPDNNMNREAVDVFKDEYVSTIQQAKVHFKRK